MKLFHRRPSNTLLLLLLCSTLSAVSAQSPNVLSDKPEAAQELSPERIESGRKAVEADASLDDARKQKALGMYDQAAQWLQQAVEAKAQLTQLESLVNLAPQKIEEIRNGKARAAHKRAEVEPIVASASLESIELALSGEQLALQQAREAQRKHEDELARLLVGSKGLSEEIGARMKALEQIESDLKAPAVDEPAPLAQARQLMLQSRRTLRQAELSQLKLRLGSHDLLTNLAQAERDLSSAEVVELQKRVDTLSQAAQKLREEQAREARQQADELKSKSETLPEPLQIIAQENARYRTELEGLISREQSVLADLEAARLGLDGVKSDFDRTRQRVDVVGTTQAIGKMLARRRGELPSLQSYRRNTAQRGAEIGRATDRQIDIEELLRQRGDVRTVIANTLNALPEAERTRYEPDISELARVRRDALNELQKVYGRYIGQITSLDLAKRQLVEVAGAYVKYIDDQLVWVPGAGVTELFDLVGIGEGVFWLLAPGQWAQLAVDAMTLLQKRPLWIVLLAALFLLLLNRRRRSMQRLESITRSILKVRTDAFKYTLLALLDTAIIIGAWPLLLIASGWLFATLSTSASFTLAVAAGLIKAGTLWVSITMVIQICRTHGLGDRHFGWPKPVRDSLIREFSWLFPLAVPLGFLVALAAGADLPSSVKSVGRVAFIFLMLASSVFVYRLLRRGTPMIEALRGGDGSASRPLLQLHFLWFPLLLLLPLTFAAISIAGYHYAALHLEQRADLTFWFFVALFLLKELLLRSLYIVNRRMRLEEALRRREELRAEREREETRSEDETPQIPLDIPEVNFEALTEQNKRLVRAGFLFGSVIGVWSIWSDLLPALGFLNNTELPFHASRIVDGIVKEVPVTLGDLTLGLILVAITVLAAKNIPGVLEVSLLQRLPLDAGVRYAITSLTQYTIAGIGVLIAFSTLGLQWSSVQWLVAALSVGLGFGLQEIVANFISGIILLFERPIRVGDVVTINNTTGKVARIRIRATTIINWDKQELLIPNKEFITGQVINWTLSDRLNRILVVVGVAYGSDIDKAMKLMLEVAHDNENVLEDPEPVVSFDAFGDNALTLTLRSYLDSLDNRLATITALHRSVNERFAAAGINIAFPQRDVHLDTSKPLDIRVHPVPTDARP